MQFNSTETETTVNSEPKEKKENFFVESKKLLENYVRDRVLLIKLEASKSAANATAGIVNGVLLAVFGLFALIFVSITLGFVFSKLTGSFIWGFAIVAAIYIALIITVIATRKWLTKKVSNAVISSIYSKKKEAKEDDSHAAKN
jgi:energy-coupling factor transporter transmembrane protein EcfT